MCIRDSRTAALYPGKIFPSKPEEEKEPATEVPVSYTHLDVYKRQILCLLMAPEL